MPLVTAGRNALLDSGKAVFTHVGAYTDIGTTEVSGGAYARQAITWAAAGSGAVANSGAISIPIPVSTTVQTVGFFSASTAGTAYGYGGIGSSATKKGVGSVDSTSTELIQSDGHGLATDDRIFFWPAGDAALPTGISANTLYFVLAAGATADLFAVSTASGGAAVNITALGELAFGTTTPTLFSLAGNLTIANGALTIDLTFA